MNNIGRDESKRMAKSPVRAELTKKDTGDRRSLPLETQEHSKTSQQSNVQGRSFFGESITM
jgi:hypothetical protein